MNELIHINKLMLKAIADIRSDETVNAAHWLDIALTFSENLREKLEALTQ